MHAIIDIGPLLQAGLDQLQAHLNALEEQLDCFNSFSQKLLELMAHVHQKDPAGCAMGQKGETLTPAAFEKLWKQLERRSARLQVRHACHSWTLLQLQGFDDC